MSEAVNIPQLRFSEFSGEWEKNIFKNIVKLQRGSSPRPIVKYVTTSKDGVNWIKIGDIVSEKNFIDSTKEKITQEGAKKSRKVSVGEIILSNSMSYGKPIILNIDGYIHDGWFVIRGFENSFDKSYLLQVLGSEWIQKQYKRLAAGGVVNNISSELVNSVKINLPIKPEQQKIAAFLTAVDNKIEQLSKKKALLGSWKKGAMQQIFSQAIRFKADDGSEFAQWEERKLGDIGNFYRGHSYNSTNVKDDGLLVIRSSNIKNGSLILDKDLQFVDKDCSDNISLRNDDIVICMANGSKRLVGKSGVYHGDYNNKLTVGAFCSIYRADNLLSQYILQTVQYRKYLHILLAGTNINNLKNSELAELKFNLPVSNSEQTKIANFLSSIDNKIEQVGKQLVESKQFKKALLQQMFV